MFFKRAVPIGGFIAIAILSGLLLAGSAWAQTQEPPREPPPSQPAPPAEGTAQAPPATPPQTTPPQATPAPPAQAPAAAAPPAEARPRDADGTEYWPAFRGHRLKIGDTLIAGFMALLFLATLLLWRATRRLVHNAELAAERQLRAYLAVVPKGFTGFKPGTIGRIDLVIKNLGQTPAQKIRHRFEWAVLPNPLPARHAFARPTREAGSGFALLPRDETESQISGQEPFTAQQIEAISRNEARVYCWGYTEFEDVFRARWRSKLLVSAGGEAFARAMTLPPDHPGAPQWSWELGSGHNEIEWG
ncbi:MAG: hypothetical protein K2Y27_32205 [Xanthobacteraceae bacterium]|nr:hypothetical protein [Xanthobacteraceae bacterium]